MDNEKELSLAFTASETPKVALESDEDIGAPSHKKISRIRRTASRSRKREEGDGARHIPHYVDQHEDYVPVSRLLLRELSSFGWLQEGCGAAGTFFFSGAFWLLLTMLFEHGDEYKKYVPWFLMCIISMIFGSVLLWVGYSHFKLKQDRISEIFRENPTDIP
jgi:hypothetical protein